MKEIISKAMSSGLDFSQKGVLKSFLYKMDIDEDTYDRVYVAIKNNSLEEAVGKSAYEDRIVLLPQCLRDPEDCEAELKEEGYECNECGRCEIGDIKKISDELGYKNIYIVPGSSMAKKIIKEKEPEGIIAVACHPELVEGFEATHIYDIPVQAVPLSETGCVDTSVDLKEVEKKLRSSRE